MLISLHITDNEELLEYAVYESEDIVVSSNYGDLCIVNKEGIIVTFTHEEVIQMVDKLSKRFVLRNKDYNTEVTSNIT